ncbi:GNAT family N-acetyltransferase [Aureimonas pseudogalii]|uniref:RimJ/RimL family protein N-acetyltransferase n=1 Tax=Aureimonas pseudogalii TaxID=1744844 RepID=A0A7W6MM45_9HYPH|nr:GNAT family N-acetyltransferase [Aureimonas pseudogalii]MBB4000482.1 RimJ/RimL family protein N-acetyltransferase [Aureimonas pseudogalii]
MQQPPVLSSHRLKLRSLHETDHKALLDLARDDEVTRYLHEGPTPSLIEVANRVVGANQQWKFRGYGMMAAEDSEGFVGRLGAYHPADAPDPLLVYAFSRQAWGKGYATEAVSLFLNWMEMTHPSVRLVAHVNPKNEASARVLSKLGGSPIGTTVRADSHLDVWALTKNL